MAARDLVASAGPVSGHETLRRHQESKASPLSEETRHLPSEPTWLAGVAACWGRVDSLSKAQAGSLCNFWVGMRHSTAFLNPRLQWLGSPLLLVKFVTLRANLTHECA